MRYKVFMAVNISILVCWVVKPWNSGLMMKAACSSETLVSTHNPTWHFNPDDKDKI
jgi:hypothetical protein